MNNMTRTELLNILDQSDIWEQTVDPNVYLLCAPSERIYKLQVGITSLELSELSQDGCIDIWAISDIHDNGSGILCALDSELLLMV
jgi:hypothetical protein